MGIGRCLSVELNASSATLLRPEIQSPGYVEKAPPKGGFVKESGAPDGATKQSCYHQKMHRASSSKTTTSTTGFSRFPSDVAGDFQSPAKGGHDTVWRQSSLRCDRNARASRPFSASNATSCLSAMHVRLASRRLPHDVVLRKTRSGDERGSGDAFLGC